MVATLRSLAGRLASTARIERWGGDDEWLAVLFHHITDPDRHRADDPRVRGLGADISVEVFASTVHDLCRHYDVVGLDDVLSRRRTGRKPAALICFDDAYASVVDTAAPLLRDAGVPWVFFVAPRFLDGGALAIDNLLAFVVNQYGTTALTKAFGQPVHSLRHAIAGLLPHMGPRRREQLMSDLARDLQLDVAEIASSPRLYLSASELTQLADDGVEIGNHTYDHVHGRALDHSTAQEQIVDSQTRLQAITRRRVRSFAYPYGGSADATALTTSVLRASDHDSAFLVDGRPNRSTSPSLHLHRVSITANDPAQAALQLRVLPRLRVAKARWNRRPGW